MGGVGGGCGGGGGGRLFSNATQLLARFFNKSSTSRRRGFSLQRGSSPHAWQRKIALNTAQMETKSRPKDAHRGIDARSLFSRRRLVCLAGEPLPERQPYNDVLWSPYRPTARGLPIVYILLLTRLLLSFLFLVCLSVRLSLSVSDAS